MSSRDLPTRPLLEVVLGFVGALLIVPLLFKTVTGVARGLFRFRTTRRLLADAAVAGVSALLLREDVLDRLFGRRGESGGLLKSSGQEGGGSKSR